MKKKIFVAVVSIAIFAVTFLGLQRLVMPKYMDDIVEGAFISEYYQDAGDHDVIFVGKIGCINVFLK